MQWQKGILIKKKKTGASKNWFLKGHSWNKTNKGNQWTKIKTLPFPLRPEHTEYVLRIEKFFKAFK